MLSLNYSLPMQASDSKVLLYLGCHFAWTAFMKNLQSQSHPHTCFALARESNQGQMVQVVANCSVLANRIFSPHSIILNPSWDVHMEQNFPTMNCALWVSFQDQVLTVWLHAWDITEFWNSPSLAWDTDLPSWSTLAYTGKIQDSAAEVCRASQ